MKRGCYIGFFLLQTILPLCLLIGSFTESVFVLTSDIVFLLLLSVLSVLLTIGILRTEHSFLALPAVFLAIVNSTVILFHCGWQSLVVVFLLPLCGWLILVRMPKGWLRITAIILNGLLTVLFLMSLPVMLFGISLNMTTEVMMVDSPDGRHTAIVQAIDQGALGGDTRVLVQDNNRTVSIGIGSFIHTRGIYWGDWSEFQDMELHWQTEEILVIDGIAYNVSREDLAAIGNIAEILGAEINDGVLLTSEDSHGGFLGDGLAYAEIRCNLEIPDSEYWHPLPLSDTLTELTARNGLLTADGRSLAPPEIRNGYYFFMDEFDGKSPDDSQLLGRYSYNFTLALYDADTNMLYYYELDT